MQTRFGKITLVVLAAAWFSSCLWMVELCQAQAPDVPHWGQELSVGLYSGYMFRGKELCDDLSLQPSLSTSYFLGNLGSIAGNIWGHLPVDTDSSKDDIRELDFTLVHDISFEPLTSSLGHTWYTYSGKGHTSKDTAEFFLSATTETVLHPTLTFYYDYQEKDAAHYELSFNQPFNATMVEQNLAINPYVALGFGTRSDPTYLKEGLAYLNYGIALELNAAEYHIAPNINYTQGIDSMADSKFWLGITIGRLF